MSENYTCVISDTANAVGQYGIYIVYRIVTPIYFVLGFCGHGSLLYAFYKQSTTESAYRYQMMISLSRMLEVASFLAEVNLMNLWTGFFAPGPSWWVSNYGLMKFSAHVLIPLLNAFITSSLLVSLSMAADRAYALSRPFAYKNMNHRRVQTAAVTGCFLTAIFLNIFGYGRFKVVPTDDPAIPYQVVTDDQYIQSPVGTVMNQLHVAVRVAGLLALICLNVLLFGFLRSRSKKLAQMRRGNDEKDAQRASHERSLLLIAVCQCLMACLGVLPVVAFYILAYAAPNFSSCLGLVMAPYSDCALQITTLVDFFLLINVSTKLRKMVFRALTCGRCRKSEQTQQLTVTSMVGRHNQVMAIQID